MQKFKIISKKLVLDSPWMPVEEQIVELPNGKQATWMVNQSSDAVIVIPQLKTREFLIQKNYKHGSGEFITEFCAGMIDNGELAKDAAKRELLEETGYQAEDLIYLGKTFANPTGSIMKYHFFFAKNCEKIQDPELEDAEQIEVFTVKNLTEVFQEFQKSGSSSASIAAITYLQKSDEFFE
jgi:8-oxo-dGTP pyrophosphatase MutT (NUDIX family)